MSQQTLEAALDWSYELLADVERVLLRRLAVFSGGFTLEAAEEVCSEDGLEQEQVADVLARLVEKSLVTTEERRGARRYRLLETIRAYADARLAEAGERAALSLRQAEWLARLVDRDDSQLSGLDPERGNLRAALETLLAGDPPAALRLCARVWARFGFGRHELSEARRWLGDALERGPEPSPVRVRALLGQAAVEYRSGSGDERLGLDEHATGVPYTSPFVELLASLGWALTALAAALVLHGRPRGWIWLLAALPWPALVLWTSRDWRSAVVAFLVVAGPAAVAALAPRGWRLAAVLAAVAAVLVVLMVAPDARVALGIAALLGVPAAAAALRLARHRRTEVAMS